MSSILEAELAGRRDALSRHPVLARLADRLERLAAGLLEGPVYLPDAKALLSRDGGVCPRDGARLAFHPYEPHRHRCDRCGQTYQGERHHRAWITRYHIWLSERAIHLALLGALRMRPDLSGRAADILTAYAGRYRAYPNADNVLGPTRLFFSTYLESIWLLQVSVAALLLDATGGGEVAGARGPALREMIGESAGIVASFDEGWSNRQVWNSAALVAADAWLGQDQLVADPGDRLATLLQAVGEDGLWHEGENYHLFALRGFLLGAEVLRWRGRDLYRDTRLPLMYGAPLATLLPDLTLPARGDAPFGVSVRQPRFAELWEVGRARGRDPRLDAILTRLYAADGPELEDGGLPDLSEQEGNRPGHRQYRDRLSWKALLWMPPPDPAGGADWAESTLLEDRGVAVIRDGAARAILMECGRRHGGHAHPDRLHLSVHWNGAILADFGTGSYVRPSLHWYRSALAHNAPVRSGLGQTSGPAAADGFEGQGRWRWCRARSDGILGHGTSARRSVFVGPDLVVDVVQVSAAPDVIVDLPIHPLTGIARPFHSAETTGAAPSDAGHETGYDRVEILGRGEAVDVVPLDPSGLVLCLAPRADETLLVARAPGPPGPDFADGEPLTFLIRRAAGPGRWIQCVAPAGGPCRVREDGPDVLVEAGGRVIRIIEGADGAVVLEPGHPPARLAVREEIPWPQAPPPPPPEPVVVRVPRATRKPSLDHWPDGAAGFDLGAPHYRRSEMAYGEPGGVRARIEVVAWGDALCFRFAVAKRDLVFRPAEAPDPALDNEPADIHSDGVQCYVGRGRWMGFLAVPEPDRGGVRLRPVAGTVAATGDADGESRRTAIGYEVVIRCRTGAPLDPGDRVRFTAVVNEMRPDRERRAGQLALAGGGWVYLRGDREAPDASLMAEIA